jgi:tetrapyrrole methylase family protein/MazG family protein
MIKIVGLGPGAREAVTLGAYEELKGAGKIFLRTEIHPTVKYLREWGIRFETYDEKYESLDSFDDIYENIALDLIKKHEEFKDIVYAVPGHPQVAEKTVSLLLGLCDEREIEYRILPAVSFIDALIDTLKIDPVGGLKIVDAFDLDSQLMDRRCGTVITQVYDKYIASEVKLKLMEYYRDDCDVYFVRAAGIEGQESIRRIKLFELDRQADIDYLTSVYIPRDTESVKDFADLLDIMDTLRGEGGCPWDREQTHESLRRYLVEESYEVIEAIDEGDYAMLSEELGDVLFQVVFHARIGKENEAFNMNDVINTICLKMINRHPHVFSKAVADTSDEVLVNWDKIKRKEQGLKSHTDELKHVAKSLPSLIRAEKVQKKAAKVGFDWESVDGALDKVLEEYHEIKEARKSEEKEKVSEEIGDLLFAAVNVARFLDIDPEYALHYTIEKFISRFKYIEDQAGLKGLVLSEMTLEEMDRLWNEAKNK